MRLILASTNTHKVVEIAEMVRSALPELEVLGMAQLGEPPTIEETAPTFAGNAVLKAKGIAGWIAERGPAGEDLVLADDSGICIDAFDGGPGVRSARFAGPAATDEQNNARMVEQLRALGREESPAHYACVLALARVDGAPLVRLDAPGVHEVDGSLCFEGRCEGVVRTRPRGTGGFGYDPYFWIDDGAGTFAELTREAKAARSHRGAAMRRLLEHLPAVLA